MLCPLCKESVADENELQVHYLMTCSGYLDEHAVNDRNAVSRSSKYCKTQFEWTKTRQTLAREVYLISSLSGSIKLEWSEVNECFLSEPTDVLKGLHSCQLIVDGDALTTSDFEVDNKTKIVNIVISEASLPDESTDIRSSGEEDVPEATTSNAVGNSHRSRRTKPSAFTLTSSTGQPSKKSSSLYGELITHQILHGDSLDKLVKDNLSNGDRPTTSGLVALNDLLGPSVSGNQQMVTGQDGGRIPDGRDEIADDSSPEHPEHHGENNYGELGDTLGNQEDTSDDHSPVEVDNHAQIPDNQPPSTTPPPTDRDQPSTPADNTPASSDHSPNSASNLVLTSGEPTPDSNQPVPDDDVPWSGNNIPTSRNQHFTSSDQHMPTSNNLVHSTGLYNNAAATGHVNTNALDKFRSTQSDQGTLPTLFDHSASSGGRVGGRADESGRGGFSVGGDDDDDVGDVGSDGTKESDNDDGNGGDDGRGGEFADVGNDNRDEDSSLSGRSVGSDEGGGGSAVIPDGRNDASGRSDVGSSGGSGDGVGHDAVGHDSSFGYGGLSAGYIVSPSAPPGGSIFTQTSTTPERSGLGQRISLPDLRQNDNATPRSSTEPLFNSYEIFRPPSYRPAQTRPLSSGPDGVRMTGHAADKPGTSDSHSLTAGRHQTSALDNILGNERSTGSERPIDTSPPVTSGINEVWSDDKIKELLESLKEPRKRSTNAGINRPASAREGLVTNDAPTMHEKTSDASTMREKAYDASTMREKTSDASTMREKGNDASTMHEKTYDASTMREKLTERDEYIKKLQAKYSLLKKEIIKSRDKEMELAKALSLAETSKAAAKEQEDIVRQLTIALNTKEQQCFELERQVPQLKQTEDIARQLTIALNTKEQQCFELERQVLQLKQTERLRQKELETTKKLHDIRVKELKSANDSLSEQVDTLRQDSFRYSPVNERKYRDLCEKYSESKAVNASLKDQVKLLEKQKQELKQKLTESKKREPSPTRSRDTSWRYSEPQVTNRVSNDDFSTGTNALDDYLGNTVTSRHLYGLHSDDLSPTRKPARNDDTSRKLRQSEPKPSNDVGYSSSFTRYTSEPYRTRDINAITPPRRLSTDATTSSDISDADLTRYLHTRSYSSDYIVGTTSLNDRFSESLRNATRHGERYGQDDNVDFRKKEKRRDRPHSFHSGSYNNLASQPTRSTSTPSHHTTDLALRGHAVDPSISSNHPSAPSGSPSKPYHERGKPFAPNEPQELDKGMSVLVTRACGKIGRGEVKFIGRLPSKNETVYIGLELNKDEGKHDGQFNGQRFFKCKPNHGIFVPFNKVVMAYI